MKRAVYFHAGCPVCVAAESQLADVLDPQRIRVEKVHLGNQPDQWTLAHDLGVRSVPALVLDGAVFHINHGADMSAIKPAR